MYVYIKNVKCAGCKKMQSFQDRGLRVKINSAMNYELMLACSSSCAQQFIKNKSDMIPEPKTIMTNHGPVAYRTITKTMV